MKRAGEIVAVCVLSILTLSVAIGGYALIRGNNATQGAVKDVGEQIVEMNGGIKGVQESLNKLPKSLGDIIAVGFAAQREQAGKKAEDEKETTEDTEKKPKPEAPAKPPAKAPAPKHTSASVAPTPPVPPNDNIPSLIQQLGESDECTWRQAGEELRKQGLAAVPQLVKALELSDPIRFRAKWCLIRIGRTSLDQLVNYGFASNNPEAQESAISAVVTIGGYDARDKLNNASDRIGRPRVRSASLKALCRLDAKESERLVSVPIQPTVAPAVKAESKPRP